MAGSRLEKVGTIFSRVRDLISSGVIKQNQKPLWFDVYAAFPPKRDPLFVKPLRYNFLKQQPVREIFYREDQIRAKFYEQYRTGPQALELNKPTYVSLCQRFVDKYMELQNQGELEESALFEATGKALLAEGVVLRRKGFPKMAGEFKENVLDVLVSSKLEKDPQTEGEENMSVEDTTLTDTPPTGGDSKHSG